MFASCAGSDAPSRPGSGRLNLCGLASAAWHAGCSDSMVSLVVQLSRRQLNLAWGDRGDASQVAGFLSLQQGSHIVQNR